tara:strand:+ start:537 stop:860 length:324 start_codon:yes stop_codon:yes gene_type:complete
MNKPSGKMLKDPTFLMVLLAAVVKKNGGEIKFVEKDLEAVGPEDLMGIYHDKDTDVFSLRVMNKEEYLATPGDTAGIIEETPLKERKPAAPRRYAQYDDDDDDDWEN